MLGAMTQEARCCSYELEIAIEAPREKVWEAILEETNAWWLPDFHVAGPDSTVTFDPRAGGQGLVEETPEGDGLVWYSPHMFQPSAYKIYLIGHIGPEWGGPATSSLKLALDTTETGCLLKVTDARHGNVDEKQLKSYAEGWTQLFTDGLKHFVENLDS